MRDIEQTFDEAWNASRSRCGRLSHVEAGAPLTLDGSPRRNEDDVNGMRAVSRFTNAGELACRPIDARIRSFVLRAAASSSNLEL